jgi:hypothetical protein
MSYMASAIATIAFLASFAVDLNFMAVLSVSLTAWFLTGALQSYSSPRWCRISSLDRA